MKKLKIIFKHLGTITKHRWFVFLYCCKCGIPWQGLIHDLSKFSYTEFSESIKYYTGTSSPIDECKKVNGVSYAWLHHKGRNKHHYEYWQDNFDRGTTHIRMPYKYAVEMLCDMLGAGRAYSGKNFTYKSEIEWWKNKQKTLNAMDPVTEQFISICLTMLAYTCRKDTLVLNPFSLEELYDIAEHDTLIVSKKEN